MGDLELGHLRSGACQGFNEHGVPRGKFVNISVVQLPRNSTCVGSTQRITRREMTGMDDLSASLLTLPSSLLCLLCHHRGHSSVYLTWRVLGCTVINNFCAPSESGGNCNNKLLSSPYTEQEMALACPTEDPNPCFILQMQYPAIDLYTDAPAHFIRNYSLITSTEASHGVTTGFYIYNYRSNGQQYQTYTASNTVITIYMSYTMGTLRFDFSKMNSECKISSYSYEQNSGSTDNRIAAM
eukprot:703495-Hanusia_phi.AAC.1